MQKQLLTNLIVDWLRRPLGLKFPASSSCHMMASLCAHLDYF